MIQLETLDLLEWPRLCEQLSTFAATKLGKITAQRVKIPTRQTGSEQLLAQTRETARLEVTTPLNFRGIQDIWEALERAELQGVLSGDALLAIATTLAGARQLRRTIEAQDEEDFPVLQQLVADLRTFPELEKAIHHCIDDRGKVTDRANPKLAGIRQKLKTLQSQIQEKLQRILQRHPGAMQELLITQRGERYVIPVKAPQKDTVPGIVHDVSTSGATLYIEPQSIVSLGNQLRQTQRQEEREEETIRQRLTEQVAEVIEGLEQLMVIVTTLDLATARARYSFWLEANPPRFIEPTEKTVLRQLRHPLLVWQQRHESGPAVVPIDVVMRPDIRVVAITGPNTGGKTVTLKTLGLAMLMAKIGLFIPAREPVELPWFEQVLADIGDEQSIEQSLSTFSGHVKRIGRILEAVGEDKETRGQGDEGKPQVAIQNNLSTTAGGQGAEVGTGIVPAQAKILESASSVIAEETPLASWDSLPTSVGEEGFDSRSAERAEGIGDAEGVEGVGFDSRSAERGAEGAREVGGVGEVEEIQNPKSKIGNSLVLLDEVGAGTDPSEGSALAIALLKHLAAHAQLTVATTHFGELKALKYEDDRFENASVEFDDVSLSPTYRLLWGIPGRSNALTIARRLGLAPSVLDNAQTLVGIGKQDDVNQVIAGLEAQRKRQEDSAEQAAKLVTQAEALRAEIETKTTLLRERETSLKQQQEKAVQAAIADARSEIAKVIRQLQKGKSTAQSAQKATEALNKIAEKQLPTGKHPAKQAAQSDYRPKVGERIRLLNLGNQTAEVLSEPDQDGKLTVRFGLMKTVVDLGEVESLTGQKATPIEKPKPLPQITQPTAPAIKTSQNTVDLRGMRVAEAESALDDFMASAQGPIWIVHGHGTGKLKRGVQAYLKQLPQVKRFEAAEQTDGGTGVTVAYFN